MQSRDQWSRITTNSGSVKNQRPAATSGGFTDNLSFAVPLCLLIARKSKTMTRRAVRKS